MSITRLANGRYRATVEDARQGLKRTRRTFDTRKQAEQWRAAVLLEGHEIMLGRRPAHTFGEALERYLLEVSPASKTHADNVSQAQALRWPFLHEGRFISLEDIPLAPRPGQLGIVAALAAWRADLRQIIKRAYIGRRIYHLRQRENGAPQWFEQDSTGRPNATTPRLPVASSALLAELDENDGRGPFSSQTLRARQSLAKAVLRCAWKDWDWLESDLGGRIRLDKPAPGRQLYLTQAQLERLMDAARASEYGDHLADAIEGAALIGWRRANLLGLQWGNVHFPAAGQIGYVFAAPEETKTGAPLAQPMSHRLEALLQRRQAHARGALVFHRGDGQPFGDFRKTWERIKEAAGVDPALRWHDLRHTWASRLIQAGATDRQIMELGGWSTPAMVQRYAHLRLEHLQEIVNR